MHLWKNKKLSCLSVLSSCWTAPRSAGRSRIDLLYEASLAHAGCDAGEATFVGDNLRNDVLAPLALVSKATTSAAGAPQYPLGFERSQAGTSSVRSTDVHLALWLQFCLRMSENYPISHTTFTHVLQIPRSRITDNPPHAKADFEEET